MLFKAVGVVSAAWSCNMLSSASWCVFCLADPQRIIVDPQPAAVQHSLLEQPQSCCSSESCQAAGTKHFVPGKSSQGTGFIAKHTDMEETLWEHHISLELFKQIRKQRHQQAL